jgi:hypothetical protein
MYLDLPYTGPAVNIVLYGTRDKICGKHEEASEMDFNYYREKYKLKTSRIFA